MFHPNTSRKRALAGLVYLLAFLAVLPSRSYAAGSATPITLDEALRLAQQRSRQLAAQDAAPRRPARWPSPPGSGPIRREGRHQQPAGRRPRPLQPHARLHDDALGRRDAGVHPRRQAPGARGTLRARGRMRAGRPRSGPGRAAARHRDGLAGPLITRSACASAAGRSSATRPRLQVEAADAAYRGGRGSQADVVRGAFDASRRSTTACAQTERQIATRHDAARALDRREPADAALGAAPAIDARCRLDRGATSSAAARTTRRSRCWPSRRRSREADADIAPSQQAAPTGASS